MISKDVINIDIDKSNKSPYDNKMDPLKESSIAQMSTQNPYVSTSIGNIGQQEEENDY